MFKLYMFDTINQPLKAKIGLVLTTLLNAVLFFAILTSPNSLIKVEASNYLIDTVEDTYLSSVSSTVNRGNETGILLKSASAGRRYGLVKFIYNTSTVWNNPIFEITPSLLNNGTNGAYSFDVNFSFHVHVYGTTNNNWQETNFTYNEARNAFDNNLIDIPKINDSSADVNIDLSNATHLGTITIPALASSIGRSFSLNDTSGLSTFLTNSNGQVTFYLVREPYSNTGYNLEIASRENSTFNGPRLLNQNYPVFELDPLTSPFVVNGPNRTFNILNGLSAVTSGVTFENDFLNFNGSNANIFIMDNPLIEPGSDSFSIEAWIKPNSISNNQIIVAKTDGGLARDWAYGLRLINGGAIRFEVSSGLTSTSVNSTGTTLLPNEWYHVVGVFNNEIGNKSLQVFLNGQLVNSISHSSSGIRETSSDLYIGSFMNGSQFGQWFNGQMGSVSIYNRSFNQQDVQTNYLTQADRYFQPYSSYSSGIIRIDKSKVEGDLTNFPVTIVLNSGNFDFSQFLSDGRDVFFTDTNNNLLPFEVDYFNFAEKRAVYHVLYSGIIQANPTNQDILIRYGAVDGHFYDFSNGFNPTEVWKNDYEFVSHMSNQVFDSTGKRTVIDSGTTLSNEVGVLGQARQFDANQKNVIIISGVMPLGSDQTLLARFRNEPNPIYQGKLQGLLISGISDFSHPLNTSGFTTYLDANRSKGISTELVLPGVIEVTSGNRIPSNLLSSGVLAFQLGSNSNQSFFGVNVTANYMMELTGWFIPQETGTYQFDLDGDDAVEFYLDDNLVSHFYGDHGLGLVGQQTIHNGITKKIGQIDLIAGQPYRLIIRHYQGGGGHGLSFFWQRPSEVGTNTWKQYAEEIYSQIPRSDIISSHKNAGYAFNINDNGFPYYGVRDFNNGSPRWLSFVSPSRFNRNQFELYTVTNNPLGNANIYTSGLVSSGVGVSIVTPVSNTIIGQDSNQFDLGSSLWLFNGVIDEIRLSSVERSAHWVKAEYYSIEGQLANPIYTLTFNTNGGTQIQPISGVAGSSISMPSNPTRTGFQFEGWFLDPDFTEATEVASTISNNDITYYANWRPVKTIALARPLLDNKTGLVTTGSINSFLNSGFTSSGVFLTNSTQQASSVFLERQFNASSDGGFSTYFVLDVYSAGSVTPADGVVFVIAANQNSLGQSGGGLGYSGITNSIGLEIDFYNNGSEPPVHIDLHQNGVTDNAGFTTIDSTTGWSSVSGTLFRRYHMWIDYQQSSGMSVYVTSGTTLTQMVSRPATPVVTYSINLNEVFGNSYFVGFTGATGGQSAQFVISSFYFSTTPFDEGIDITTTTYTEDSLDLTAPLFLSSQILGSPSLTISSTESNDPLFSRMEYRVNGGDWTTYTNPVTLTASMNTVAARSVSVSGRTGATSTYTVSKVIYTVDTIVEETVILTADDSPKILKTNATDGARIATWYESASLSGSSVSSVTYPALLVVYGASLYESTVTLEPGFSQDFVSITVTMNQPMPSGVSLPSQPGYTFFGYFTEPDGNGIQYYNDDMTSTRVWPSKEGATLYASWQPNSYTVSFNNSGVIATTQSVTFNDTYGTLPTVSRTGYTFHGWFTATTGGTEVTSGTVVTITSDQTLYARFTPLTFTVTFDSNQGDTPSPTTITVTYDEVYGTLATVDRSGYSFVGWFTATTGGTEVTSGTLVTITSDQTLTASWEAEAYTVTLDSQLGTGGSPSVVVSFDAPMPSALTAPTRTGYAFDGYYSAISGAGTKYYDSGMVTVQNWNIPSDTTLFANWIANSIVVTLDANNGSVTPTSFTLTFDGSYGTLPTPVRSGYTFTGWFTALSGGTVITESTNVTNPSDHTLYARWSENTYTVTYVVNSGVLTGAISSYSVTSGTITLPTTITRTYHRFDGWYESPSFDNGPVASFAATDVSNKTFYAKWIEDSTTVIKIAASKIDATLTNFPLTIVLTDDNFDFTGVQTSGIYFTDANQTLLDFEIESVRLSPRRYIYHVRVPVVSHTVDTIVNLRVSQEIDYSLGNNPLGVWDANYVFVSHMGSTLTDATGNVTTTGSNFGTTVVDTPFGQARRFNGTNQYITFDQMGPLTQMNNSSLTVVAIALLSEQPSTTFRLIANTGGGWAKQGFFFATDSTGIRNQMGTGSSETIWYAPGLRPTNNTWQLIGMGYNAQTSRQVSYLNTSMETSTSTFGDVYDYRTDAKINIGAGKVADSLTQTATTNVTSARFFKGDLAAFRISNVSRSAAWVKAEYFSLTNDLVVFAGRPVVTLVGDSIVDVPINTPYTEQGATAKSADGVTNLSNQITIAGTVNTGVLGVYPIDYSIVEAGITATATRVVRVVDITPPTVTLSGSSPFAIPFSATPYTIQDPGLIITDDVDTGLTPVFLNDEFESVPLESLVNVTVMGDYTVTYVVQDFSGNQTTIQRTFQVRDLTPPVITLTGSTSVNLTYGQVFTEPGHAYSDNVTPTNQLITSIAYHLSSSGVTNGVHSAIPGTYTITYTATDAAGNTATATRTVTIANTFDQFRFTTGGQEGRLGPTLSQLQTAYNTTTHPWLTNSSIFTTSNGIQRWTVPVTGTYRIRVAGASGRNLNNNVGEGAIMEAEFNLVAGQQLYILVGQQSTYDGTRDWQGGAGGTFVAFGPSIATAHPLIVAGGGGTNRSTATGGQEIMRANTGTSGKNGTGSSGGTNGNAALGGGHNQGGGGSAGGFYTTGVIPTDTRFLTADQIALLSGGASFRSGGVGGYFYSYYANLEAPNGFIHGAFGGGGPAGWGGAGGGGGYSGGGNDRNTGYTGGGGSFVDATAMEVKTSDGSFVRTGSEPTLAYSGSVENLNQWNIGAGYVEIELAPAPIALIGLDVMEQAFGFPYDDLGVSVGAAASNVVITSAITQLNKDTNQFVATPSVNSAVLNGVFRVTYTVTYTQAGEPKELTLVRQITIKDLTPPVVTLSGLSSMIANLGDPFVDPGVIATDDLDLNPQITFTVSVLESGLNAQPNIVDVNEEGLYRITYFVTDNAGNQTAITRDVTVKDIAPPVVTPTGDTTIFVELGSSYTDAGFTFTDNDTGVFAKSSGIAFAGAIVNAVNPNQLGTYTFTYNVTDPSGNTGVATRTVIVRDTTPPAITLLGLANLRIPHGVIYNDSGVTVFDVSGSVTPTVVNPVDTNNVGFYTITYDAVDPSGNHAIQVTRVVEVFDEVLPNITGIANATINASVAMAFELPIPTITDNTGNIASSGVAFFVTSGMIPLSSMEEVQAALFAMQGVTIRYTAADPSGNQRVVDITRTPIDNIIPVLSGLSDVGVSTPNVASFALPMPTLIDNDPAASYSVRAILGAASASSLTLLRANQITSVAGLSFCNVATNTCNNGTNSPGNEGPILAFDQRQNTKYLNFNKLGAGVQFNIDESRSLARIVFKTANDASERDPMTFVLQGRNNNNEWVTLVSGNTGLPTSRYALGSVIEIQGAASYQTYRVFFPTIRNSASANSMQIADIFLYVNDTVTTTDIAVIRNAILTKVPVTLEYTAVDPSGNQTVVLVPVSLVNFVPVVNANVTIPATEAIANQPFVLPYPADLMIDLDEGEVLTYDVTGLPPGLEFDAETMTIVGEPTVVEGLSIEDYEITITATDAELAFVTRTHTIRVFYVANITFIANGGSAVGTQTNIISQPLPTPPSPGRTGYTFEGWYENETLTLPFDWDGVMGDTDITLYAKWEIINYPIQYVFNISNTPLKGSYTIEEETHLFQPASSAGRTFMGWFYDAAFTQEATQINAGSTGPVTVYARWEANEYTLSYRANGRTVSSVTVRFGEPVPGGAPAIPPREGFIAVGWSSEAPEFMPARSIRIEAIYEELPVEEVDDPIDEEVIDEPLDEEELDDEPLDDELDDEDEVDDETEEEPGDEEVEVPLDTVTPDEPTPTPLPSAPNPILPPANVIIPSRTPQRVEIPVVVLPENPDPVVTRVSVNGIDLDISIIPGQPVGNLPPATLAGYNFQGWMNAITGEMMTPETVINNPDFVVLVPLFEKAPTLLDATRNVFQQLIVNPLLQIGRTNDFTTRTDNITSTRIASNDVVETIPIRGGLVLEVREDGSVTIPLPNERTPIKINATGLDASH
jgi:uncharacterized repeat protein (TIGR02543 family)